MIRIKRTYESRARGDGRRILVERLWPRGMKKGALQAQTLMLGHPFSMPVNVAP
jgi:uncharacterized protein YeaO (DUF488 family)